MIQFTDVYYQSEDLMVQKFVENATDLGSFIEKGDKTINRHLAKVGMNSFYRMIFYDNFIHADCHAGNFLI